MRRHRALGSGFALVALVASRLIPARAAGQEAPRRGGVLLAAIAADAPSLDPHQEQTFATMQLVAPLYSTLIQIDPLAED
jgi:ABC-type oligopeptide transport system substrate-binding subunit